jgi:hypothetical protein
VHHRSVAAPWAHPFHICTGTAMVHHQGRTVLVRVLYEYGYYPCASPLPCTQTPALFVPDRRRGSTHPVVLEST